MKALQFHPEAEIELISATDFYESSRPGLGTNFIGSVGEALQLVQSNPDAGVLERGRLRKWCVGGFPYSLLYRDEDATPLGPTRGSSSPSRMIGGARTTGRSDRTCPEVG